MSEQLDYTTLTWVKDEIQESLNQTYQALEAYIEDPSDTTQIRFCATYLHQIYGTLQMVEIYGAALLAEEMEKVANALLNGEIAQQQDAFDVLIRAILQMPSYLERLENGQPDLPVVLTPLLNDMRAARGEPLLSENAFFSPKLSTPPPEKRYTPGKDYPEIQGYAKKLRPIYQVALLGFLRNKDATGSLKRIVAVLRELQNACDTETAQRLWWVAGGIVESLLDDGLQSSTALKMLLGQIDREIKRLVKDGEAAIEADEPADLIKNCLYYSATSSSAGPRVTALKQAFGLEELLPYGGAMEAAADDLKGSTADILDSVSSVIKEELLQVKDQLDIFVRNADREVSQLAPLAENLARTADTLAMLSLGDLRRVIQTQSSHIQQLVEKGENPADTDLMEIASALLYVESSLEHIKEAKQSHAEDDAPDLAMGAGAESSVVLLPRTEQVQITNLVIKEAKEVLADVKEGFNTFAVEPNQMDAISEAPAKLAQIQGALAVMNLERAARLLGAANAYIREDVIAAQAHPDSVQLDTLADAITSIEYYLEAIEEGRGQPEGVLAVAEISVEQLGHPIESVSAIINVESDALPAQAKSSPADEPEKTQELAVGELTGDVFTEATQEIVAPAGLANAPAEAEEYLEEDIDEEILEIFVEEADEVLGVMTDCLHAWRANTDDKKSLETLRRSYHTIKGSGRLAGAMVMGEFAWSIENMLNRVMDNRAEPNPGMFALMDNAEIVVRGLLAHLKKETDVRPPIKALAAQADAITGGAELSVSEIVSVAIPVAAELDGGSGDGPAAESEVVEPEIPEADTDLSFDESAVTEDSTAVDDAALLDELPETGAGAESETGEATPELNIDIAEELEAELDVVEIEEEPALDDLPATEDSLSLDDVALLDESVETDTADSDADNATLELEIDTSKESFAVPSVDQADDERSLDDSFVSEDAVDSQQPLETGDVPSLEDSISELEDIALGLTPNAELDADLNIELNEAFSEELDQAASEESNENEVVAEEAAAVPERDPALVEVFRKETATHVGAIREFLFNADGNDTVVDDDLHRALHTLHGSARMADVAAIAELSEPMDRVIRAMHERALPLNNDGQNLLRAIAESIESIVAAFTDDAFVAPDNTDVLSQIASLHEAAMAAPAPAKDERAEFIAAAIDSSDHSDEDAELIAIFVEEADEILASSDAMMQQWAAAGDGDHSALAEMQRALHTLKGGARLANIFAVGDVTHDLETVLEGITEGNKSVTSELPALVQQGLDWLVQAIDQVRNGEIPEDATDLRAQIASLSSTGKATDVGQELEPEINETPTVEIVIDELPTEQMLDELILPDADDVTEALSEEAFEELSSEVPEVEMVSTEPEAVSAAVDVDYDPDLLEVFLEEADELQEGTEIILQKWAGEPDNLAHVAELQRLLHTLKGGARMANVLAVGNLAHEMESLLERVADGRTKPQVEHIGLIQSCHDWLVTGLEAARKLRPTEVPVGLLEQLEAAIRGETFDISVGTESTATVEAEAEIQPEIEAGMPAAEVEISEAPIAAAVEMEELTESIALDQVGKGKRKKITAVPDEQVRVRAGLLNNLVNFSGEVNIYNSRIAQQLGASRFNLAELEQTVLRLREQLRKFEIETETQIMYRHETTSSDTEDFDPLEMDRFSTMQQLSRGMVESLGDLTSIQDLLVNHAGETDVLLLQQQRVTSELQEGLMRTRMVSFSSVMPRLRRIMRQTCKEIGKEAELMVTGGEGEMDRTQLNRIVPALEHILRNAIGHGLEMPEARRNVGKPASGNVHIMVAHQGSEVVLTISDDGAGIDLVALREMAVEKGHMLVDADLSDAEIMEFILESGFSTAQEVTQISGRGVGLDVVNTEVKQLGGTLHIDSEAGKGTTFTLRLPLTVLVNQALMVQVADATYAIQLPNIEHVVRAGHGDLAPLIANEQSHFGYAGHRYQYLNLGMVLQGTAPQLPADRQRVPLMLIRSGDHRIALHVDNLLGRQEIVIKSVGPQLSAVGVLSGATILPSGEVALILDIGNLVRSALAQQHGQSMPLMPSIEAVAEEKQVPTVMIVDDSITVRKVTERLLKRYDYNIITAKDGVDALTVMIEQVPDIMLLDVEMPRMDGYELATTMRNDERLGEVPIIMITSRTGDKHRQRAFDIGVDQYMGKPYQEQELIENIRLLIGTKQH